MTRNRPLAAALLLPLAAAGLVASGTSPTAAAQAHLAPLAATPGTYLIQGVVADAARHYLDDVSVEAVRDGRVVASDLTYASPRDGGPQHGYFFLEVRDTGSYTVTLRRAGYKDATIQAEVGRHHRKDSLGEIELQRKPVATSTTARLRAARISTADKARVTVTVSTSATRKPTGAVQVRSGRKVLGSDVLTASDRGTVTVGLRRLEAGTYHLEASYAGSRKQGLKSSGATALTLQVVRARHHQHRRPKAW